MSERSRWLLVAGCLLAALLELPGAAAALRGGWGGAYPEPERTAAAPAVRAASDALLAQATPPAGIAAPAPEEAAVPEAARSAAAMLARLLPSAAPAFAGAPRAGW